MKLGETLAISDYDTCVLVVNDSDIVFPAWQKWYLENHPEATREEAMHAAWHYGYRARLIQEGMPDAKP